VVHNDHAWVGSLKTVCSAVHLVLLLVFCAGPVPVSGWAAPASPGFIGAIQAIKRSVIPIACISINGTTAETVSVEGTGFFVAADGTFITANHVIDSMLNPARKEPCSHTAFCLPQAGRWSSDQATLPSNCYVFQSDECKRDAEIDIARCRSSRPVNAAHRIMPVTFETSVQPDGTPVAFTAFPLQFQVPLSSVGNVSGYVRTRDDGRGPRSMIMDKEAWPGASGSPLYLANGKVIGLLSRRGINDGSGRTIAVPSRLIQEFLKANAEQ